MHIRKLENSDFDTCMNLIHLATRAMVDKGIDQWDEIYPDSLVISHDIETDTAFGLFVGTNPTGYIVLNEDEQDEYKAVEWKFTEGRWLLIHRLCIHPAFQGKGYAKALLDFAEKYAKTNSFSAIRLDAFIKNKRALELYEKNDYRPCGTVYFRKGAFTCFEKKLQ